MTVQELIDLLQKVNDKNKSVRLVIYTCTQAYPVAYVNLHKSDYLEQAWGEVRISAWLPDGMHTVQRNKKNE